MRWIWLRIPRFSAPRSTCFTEKWKCMEQNRIKLKNGLKEREKGSDMSKRKELRLEPRV